MASISSSDSDDSEDEFLAKRSSTGARPITEAEREAIIRRKLLESFYGANANKASSPDENAHDNETKQLRNADPSSQEEEEDDDDHDVYLDDGKNDLDSSNFDAHAHNQSLLRNSNVKTLLETDERLALDIRTLNSTMQTLVYENYSKFIDATDAVRSIGQSVDASEEGLKRLTAGINRIEQISRSVDAVLSKSRAAVAEKVKVRRHLSKLDSLLKLPDTLESQIEKGKYRLAAKSHASAAEVLAKFSSDFESLARIESVCNDIMVKMGRDLKWKLLHWSGHAEKRAFAERLAMEGDDDDHADDDVVHEEYQGEGDGLESSRPPPPPPPPENVAEIFECAGTLVLLTSSSYPDLSPSLAEDRCKSLSLDACAKYLQQILDDHQTLMERNYDAEDQAFDDLVRDEKTPWDDNGPNAIPKRQYHTGNIIPTVFLDGILEASTLYGVTFPHARAGVSAEDQTLLGEFVSDLFATFLAYVRTALLELSLSVNQDLSEDDDDDDDDRRRLLPDDEDGFAAISTALTNLIFSVRELASGLALPEVGVEMRIASDLVDQTVEVTESMIRRYVSLQFHTLRRAAARDCLAPFLRDAVATEGDCKTKTVVDIVRMASVALDDIMQLLDGLIVRVVVLLSCAPVESAMVKLAVQKNCKRFGSWLATAFEVLAGCDTIAVGMSDGKVMLQVEDEEERDDGDGGAGAESRDVFAIKEAVSRDDVMSELSYSDESESDDDALRNIVAQLEQADPSTVRNLVLAIAELCRLAEKSVVETINQSIANSFSSNKGDTRRSFGVIASAVTGNVDAEGRISNQFQTASSRILALYTTDQGNNAAIIACRDLISSSSTINDDIPTSPRDAICQILRIAKSTSIDFANVFGGERKSGPIPNFNDSDTISSSSRGIRRTMMSGIPAMKGLQLDVERMFSEKTPIYSNRMEFARDAVVASVFSIAFKALVERCRTCTFTIWGYRQMQIDVELLRIMIPYYVKVDLAGSLFDLMYDVLLCAGERCVDGKDIGEGGKFYDSAGMVVRPANILRRYLEDNDDVLSELIFREEEDDDDEKD